MHQEITMPHSKESEMMVLGSMLTNNDALKFCAESLIKVDFYFTEHKVLFEVLQNLHASKKPADIHLVAEELKNQGDLEKAGGIAYLVTLAQYVGTSAYVEEYVDLVKDKSILRKMLEAGQKLERTALNSAEKIEFYEHLRSLENTKIIFKRKIKKYNHSKYKPSQEYLEYEIRLLEIHGKIVAHDSYPNEITLTILNTSAFQNEKTTFVGAAIKNKTLELHSDDASFALWIQTRKSQRMGKECVKVDRDSLYMLAGLQKTSETNRAHANKLLLVKLRRLMEKGILLSVPEKIEKIVMLQIR